MTRVFMLEPARQDASGLTSHGEVTHVFPTGARRASIWSERFLEQAIASLESLGYDPARDWFSVVGSVVPVSKVVCELVARHSRVRLLYFNTTTCRYEEHVTGECRCEKI